jgi:hypothetical protein
MADAQLDEFEQNGPLIVWMLVLQMRFPELQFLAAKPLVPGLSSKKQALPAEPSL